MNCQILLHLFLVAAVASAQAAEKNPGLEVTMTPKGKNDVEISVHGEGNDVRVQAPRGGDVVPSGKKKTVVVDGKGNVTISVEP